MKTFFDLLLKSAQGVAALIICVAVIAGAAFFWARYAGGTSTPTTVRSLGPTVQYLEGMGQLATVRVHVTDVIVAEGEGYRGSWLVKGDALLASDMSRAVIVERDEKAQRATIRLPIPKPLSARVDHEKTKEWSVEKTTWIPWRLGDQKIFRDAVMYHAQKLVEQAAASSENVGTAKAQTELVIRKTYDLVDWHVNVRWDQDSEQVLDTPPTQGPVQ